MAPNRSDLDAKSQLELLLQMVEEISGELALEPLLERIIEQACQLIGADDGVIGLYVPELDVIRTAASFNIPKNQLRDVLKRGEGLTGRVLELGAPVRCRYRDLPHPTRVPALDMDMIGMPIRSAGRLVGVFGIGARPPRSLGTQALDLLDLFSRHAAVAIDNARRYTEEKRRASRFALIARVAAIGAAGADLDTLLQQVADAIHETLEYPSVDIPLIDSSDPDTLVIRVRGGEYKKRIHHVDRLSTSEGVMGAAVRQRRMQLVNDVASDARYVKPPGVRMPKAELAVPILHGGQMLGVLNVEADRHFDDLDAASMEIVAEHLGVAIVNARLFEQSTRIALLEERQRLARDLHDNVTQILSSINLIAQSLQAAWSKDPKEGEYRATRLGELARLASAELRSMLRELSPREEDDVAGSDEPLPTRLQCFLHAMVPPNVQLSVDAGAWPPQPREIEEAILRICQEAVSNAVRHGNPSVIEVSISSTKSELLLRVTDDGRGIGDARSSGMGLRNMRHRLAELGGRIEIKRRNPKGTAVVARLARSDRSPE